MNKKKQIVESGAWMMDIDEITTNYRERLIPAKVKEVIQRRLRRLGEAERELLTLAAVAGQRFEYRVLEHAWGGPMALALVEALARSQLRVAANGHYEFNHEQANGQSQLARAFLQKAYAHMMHLAEDIEDEKMRRLFLDTKLNREILGAWEQAQALH
jgi:predicted ATPase